MSATWGALILLAAVSTLLGLGLAGLLARVQFLEQRLTEELAGTRKTARLDNYETGRLNLNAPFVAVFLQPGCLGCAELVAELRAASLAGTSLLHVHAVVAGESKAAEGYHALPFGSVRAVPSTEEVFEGIPGFPWLVAVDKAGVQVMNGPGSPLDKAIETVREIAPDHPVVH